jgi:hypothetical protein
MPDSDGSPAAVASSTGGPLIFLSYRREDTAGYAGRLYDALGAQFGRERIFMDVDNIPPGVDFGDHIDAAVGRCDALLALIGPRWVTAAHAGGERRIDDPADYLRLEIEAALRRNVLVIPVLVQGAHMPGPAELPERLRALTRRNARREWDFRPRRARPPAGRSADPDPVRAGPGRGARGIVRLGPTPAHGRR